MANTGSDQLIGQDLERPRTMPWGRAIPTEDPEIALAFCRALAMMFDNGVPFVDGVSDPQTSPLRLSQSDLVHRAQPEISVVVPVYNEEENLAELYARLCQVLDQLEPNYEIVFIDDGSRDGSLKILQDLVIQDPRVVAVELARNFGHQIAISAGLTFARGNAVIIMDGDLQDPPELLPTFISKWRERFDVVYAIRERRKERWLKRSAYAAFYRVFKRIADIDIPLDAGDFCLLDRRVVDLLVQMPERNRFLRGIRSWVGLKQVGVPYERQARFKGSSKYTVSRLMFLALDGIVSFSYMPLRMITLAGFAVSVMSILLAAFYTVKRLFFGLNPPGFATLVVAIFLLSGVQLITVGVIGEYVGRIFEEVKRRPLFIARRVVRNGRPNNP